MMTSHDAYARIRSTLKRELQRHRGHIREIEAGLDRSEGYLSKVCRGDISMPLEVLLKSLELLDADPAHFFGRALQAQADPADRLREIAETARVDRLTEDLVGAVEAAAAAVDAAAAMGEDVRLADDLAAMPEATDKDRAAVAALAEVTPQEVRRRFRATKKYRTVGFARACLDDLAARRSQDPATVAKLAASLAIELAPQVGDGSAALRFALVARAALEHVAARQMLQDHAGCAFVVGPVLSACRMRGIDRLIGDSWRFGGRILFHRGEPQHALEFYSHALVCYSHLGLRVEVARLHLNRAMAFQQLDDLESVELCVSVALRDLRAEPLDDVRAAMATALQLLAIVSSSKGDTATALERIGEATEVLAESKGVRWASTLWHHASLAIQGGIYEEAEGYLETALGEFSRLSDLNGVFVALELTELKLKQGRTLEATRDARSMASYLAACSSEPVLKAAIAQFVRAALEGELTLKCISACRHQIQSGRQASS